MKLVLVVLPKRLKLEAIFGDQCGTSSYDFFNKIMCTGAAGQ